MHVNIIFILHLHPTAHPGFNKGSRQTINVYVITSDNSITLIQKFYSG